MATFSVNWSAPISPLAGTVLAGQLLIPDGNGLYVVATTANRALYGRCDGIAMTSGDASNPCALIEAGPIENALTGLGVGLASWVRVSALGVCERVAVPVTGNDVIGWCETTGRLHSIFGNLTAAIIAGGGGGGATLPIDLTSGVSGILPAANGGTGAASLPAGGLAGVTATQTLTGKTINGASNTLTVRLASDVTGTLPAANGGLGASASAYTGVVKMAAGVSSAATLVNADVSASAAIAVSKLAAGTNTYVLTTTGGVAVWAAPAVGGSLGTYVLSGTGYVSIGPGGSTVPTTGALRLGGTGTLVPLIVWNDGVTDNAMVTIDTVGNGCAFGYDACAQTALRGATVLLYAGAGSTYIYAAGGQAMTLDGTNVNTALPMVGLNAPWGGVDGQVVIAVSTVGITLTSAQYNTKIQKLTGSPAAARNITYPLPADDAHAYTKIVWCQTTVSGVTVTNTGGSTVVLGAGAAPALLIFTPTGVAKIA
ncbi:MAG: hypothetical protein H0U66_02035 [Gemmatimonadaceae bacterium]|nr:hypothetical protein [Gemmatimonadaceae bacterium]